MHCLQCRLPPDALLLEAATAAAAAGLLFYTTNYGHVSLCYIWLNEKLGAENAEAASQCVVSQQ